MLRYNTFKDFFQYDNYVQLIFNFCKISCMEKNTLILFLEAMFVVFSFNTRISIKITQQVNFSREYKQFLFIIKNIHFSK